MTTTIEYLKILESLGNISETGLLQNSETENFSHKQHNLENRYEEFKTSCDWISNFRFTPSEKQYRRFVHVQTYNSYYLKHLVEKWSGRYISSGAFIAALSFMNIPYKPIFGTPDVSVTIFLKETATLI